MVYEWKDLASVRSIKADAQVAGEVCEELEREGRLTPENLVEVSKDENAPLHNEFEWNDDTAAKKYRRSQAQFIIQMLVVKSSDDEEEEKKPPVRAFFAIDKERRNYESVVTILESKDKTAQTNSTFFMTRLHGSNSGRFCTIRKYATSQKVTRHTWCFYGKNTVHINSIWRISPCTPLHFKTPPQLFRNRPGSMPKPVFKKLWNAHWAGPKTSCWLTVPGKLQKKPLTSNCHTSKSPWLKNGWLLHPEHETMGYATWGKPKHGLRYGP